MRGFAVTFKKAHPTGHIPGICIEVEVGNLTQNFFRQAGRLAIKDMLVSGLKLNDFLVHYRNELFKILASMQSSLFLLWYPFAFLENACVNLFQKNVLTGFDEILLEPFEDKFKLTGRKYTSAFSSFCLDLDLCLG